MPYSLPFTIYANWIIDYHAGFLFDQYQLVVNFFIGRSPNNFIITSLIVILTVWEIVFTLLIHLILKSLSNEVFTRRTNSDRCLPCLP